MLLYYLNALFYLKLYFKLEIDPKASTFKNLEEISKKISGQPVLIKFVILVIYKVMLFLCH